MSGEHKAIVRTRGLTKTFGPVTAVKELDLTIGHGEIYGLLGPNGAGKTTTIHMLLGLLPPTSGEIDFFDESFSQIDSSVRRYIGVVPEKHPVLPWKWITGYEYLSFFGELFAVDNREKTIQSLVHRVSMDSAIDRPVRTYSRGMLQRISIARALLPEPRLLVLDEPISGIDPRGVKDIRDLVLEEKRRGTSVLVSSHLLSEVEKICDRIGIIDNGILVRESGINTLLSELGERRTFELTVKERITGIEELFSDVAFVTNVIEKERGVFDIETNDSIDHRADISDRIVTHGIVPIGLREIHSSLEEAYVAITSNTVRAISSEESE